MKKKECLEKIQELMELGLRAHYVIDARIVSLIIVAEPGNGKTTLLEKLSLVVPLSNKKRGKRVD
jgi:stage III sporulation protein SpoIIIAA